MLPMDATNRFNTRAVGRVTSGATAKNAITAKYPDAPPCPTDEYRTATTKMARMISSVVGSIGLSIDIAHGYSHVTDPDLPFASPKTIAVGFSQRYVLLNSLGL